MTQNTDNIFRLLSVHPIKIEIALYRILSYLFFDSWTNLKVENNKYDKIHSRTRVIASFITDESLRSYETLHQKG